jgi:peptidoglycan/LPS O-acetylase OafA/YrhL
LFVPLVGIPLNFEGRIISAFILTVILAAASYRCLELPFLRLKKHFTPGHKPAREAVRARAISNQPDVVG